VARFFVDENCLALGRVLSQRHGDVVFPGHDDLPAVLRGCPDDEWLPVVGAHRLVVITRDQRIRYRTVEKRMWVLHRVRGFVLTGRRSQTTADSLAILEEHWAELGASSQTGQRGRGCTPSPERAFDRSRWSSSTGDGRGLRGLSRRGALIAGKSRVDQRAQRPRDRRVAILGGVLVVSAARGEA